MSANPAPQPHHTSRQAWLAHLTEIGRGHGFFERIGSRHSALFVQEGSTLLVSFDEAGRVYNHTSDGLPLGFDAVQRREWSLLNIMASGQSWFRDADLYQFFDRLVDEDFFENFDRVIFLGCGPMCGYAACAYSVTAPGARVLALSPAATLDREDAPFEPRFRTARRLNFTDRYGYAPYMLEGAAQATVLYDPYEPLAAAHAALYRGSNVQRIPMRWVGSDLQTFLQSDGALDRVLQAKSRGKLTPLRFSQITRNTRRRNAAYLVKLIGLALGRGHPELARTVARFGARETKDPRFTDYLAKLDGQKPSEPALPG
ncbi:phosphoadenosine phosphosulfate reductase [Roseobacter sp. HKCCD9010]|uniref:phosphoadenosine phosphosulfate reductase n=1 Tax=unclassified Roseobacter TaxID=196798 RepID=UPI001491EB0B|nr:MULTISPECIES: phosphoadenosine phosphosulfate reductase [unclassified Roseobacter]MBF9050018.1 phosphoadenosine phosphosulfate reductase [Rhodobacterales bacterium HKCCD4356]NNV12261.1 phosphoadenosine phosphosulfate reductase [Roseobacter sp. HKCCD7357]NNV16276.1 phosphoadenosine phosphosulfate reductase [Roseobacter sp. HKCCD8768]NNV25736.1 phosphoadenosine phosphosulfate reductase [Roseobacter sp. HKCCD8192]NNV29992.1 phosphoadenosine phosphosulfate reductase [Roseobacter sp. HKCCD9061]